VPEESSLWENLELYEPKKSIVRMPPKVEVVFDEGYIVPLYSGSRKSITGAGNTLSMTGICMLYTNSVLLTITLLVMH